MNINNNTKNIISLLNDLTNNFDEAYKHAPQGKEFTEFIISKMEEGKDIDISERILKQINEILYIIKITNQSKYNLIEKALYNLGGTKEQTDGFIKTLNSFDEMADAAIKTILNTKIKYTINYTKKLNESAPTIDRKIKGKIPKAKKQEQLLAEDWTKDIWKKNPTITQENMAYQLKDKLDLKQSIRTIQNWIKPFQPKP